MRRLLLCLALIGIAPPALACINDNELPSHEREFRSQYPNVVPQVPQDPSPSYQQSDPPLWPTEARATPSMLRRLATRGGGQRLWFPFASGIFLLTGAFAVALAQRERPRG